MRNETYNPFSGVTPNFGPFAPLVESKIGVLLAIVWAAGFVYVAVSLVIVLARLARAKQGGYHDEFEQARNDVLKPLVALVALAAVPVIYVTTTSV